MPTRDGYHEGTPCWVDLGTTDLDMAKKFYAKLFGWDYAEAETDSAPYLMANQKGLSAAGIGPSQDPNMPSAWTTYFAVENVDEAAARIEGAGGTLVMGPSDVMKAGRMAIAFDTGGAGFGIWEARDHFGAAIVNEHGGLNWNELLTDDVDRAREFYGAVFGWTFETSQMPAGPYTVFSVGDRAVGGMMPKPSPDIPNHWGTYFAVDDAATAIETTKAGGGALSHGPMDIPQVGVLAGLVDPTGAHFTVIQLAGEID